MLMTFTPRPGWLKDETSRKELAVRIAQIIGYTDVCPPFDKHGTSGGMDWTLNSSNDWWLHCQPDGTVELQYRYSWKDEQWAALKTVIEMFVGKPADD